MRASAVKGLFLSGGQSQRMGADKAFLQYHGGPEILRWKALFDDLELPFYWSQRPGQYSSDQFPDILRLEDDSPGAGPLAALLGAHRRYPEAAWLVLACDWPLLDSSTLRQLLAARDPASRATVFENAGHYEPLCAIYEPKFMQEALAVGETSLYRLLQRGPVRTLVPTDAQVFLNVNDGTLRDAVIRQISSQNPAHRNGG